MTDITEIWKFPLRKGNSYDPRNGACLLDTVSWLEYGKLGDHPPCVCPVIAAFGRGINDALNDDSRQRLRIFIPRLVGTVDEDSEPARAEYLAWQAIRVFAPASLDLTGFHERAEMLRGWSGSLNEAARAAAYAAYADAAAYAAADAAYASAASAAGSAAGSARSARDAAAYAAASAAGSAAGSARSARDAAAYHSHTKVEDAMIAALDGVLKIGKQAEMIDMPRAMEQVRLFELAAVK